MFNLKMKINKYKLLWLLLEFMWMGYVWKKNFFLMIVKKRNYWIFFIGRYLYIFFIYLVYGEGVCLKFDDFFKKNFIEFYVDI